MHKSVSTSTNRSTGAQYPFCRGWPPRNSLHPEAAARLLDWRGLERSDPPNWLFLWWPGASRMRSRANRRHSSLLTSFLAASWLLVVGSHQVHLYYYYPLSSFWILDLYAQFLIFSCYHANGYLFRVKSVFRLLRFSKREIFRVKSRALFCICGQYPCQP